MAKKRRQHHNRGETIGDAAGNVSLEESSSEEEEDEDDEDEDETVPVSHCGVPTNAVDGASIFIFSCLVQALPASSSEDCFAARAPFLSVKT